MPVNAETVRLHIGRSSLTLILLCLPAMFQVEAAHYDDESSLRIDLLRKYENTIRPSKQVTVQAMLSLLNINVLDVPSQRLSVSGWLSFAWYDPRLSWNPAQYGNITDIFDTELVFWRPEIIVDNSVTNLGILESDKLLIRATNVGNMTWEPPSIFETHCDVDVTFYPFDTQICVVEVTSWAQTVEEIDLRPSGHMIDLVDFEQSGEWDVLGSWTKRRLLGTGSDVHSEITFSIKLQRKPMYYITTILIPVIVTSILCIVVFLLPAESGEKVGYSLTILLTYTVMLTLVASYMPPTSKHTSVLSVYLTVILFIGVFTTLITVIALHLHHHPNDTEIPGWLQFLTRNCMIPLVRWRPRKINEINAMSEGTSDSFAPRMYHVNRVHPETRSSSNVSYTRCSSDGQSRDILAAIENQKHLIEYINRQRNQSNVEVENKKHFIQYISEQRNKPDVKVKNIDHRLNYSNGQQNKPDVQAETQNVDETALDRHSPNKKHRLTWQEVAVILNAFCLRVLGGFVLALTVIVLLTMAIGGRW